VHSSFPIGLEADLDLVALHQFSVPFSFTIQRNDQLHGLACWFDVSFICPQSVSPVILSTSPTAPITHWYQTRLLFQNPLTVLRGQLLTGKCDFVANDNSSYDITVTAQLERGHPFLNIFHLHNVLFSCYWSSTTNPSTTTSSYDQQTSQPSYNIPSSHWTSQEIPSWTQTTVLSTSTSTFGMFGSTGPSFPQLGSGGSGLGSGLGSGSYGSSRYPSISEGLFPMEKHPRLPMTQTTPEGLFQFDKLRHLPPLPSTSTFPLVYPQSHSSWDSASSYQSTSHSSVPLLPTPTSLLPAQRKRTFHQSQEGSTHSESNGYGGPYGYPSQTPPFSFPTSTSGYSPHGR